MSPKQLRRRESSVCCLDFASTTILHIGGVYDCGVLASSEDICKNTHPRETVCTICRGCASNETEGLCGMGSMCTNNHRCQSCGKHPRINGAVGKCVSFRRVLNTMRPHLVYIIDRWRPRRENSEIRLVHICGACAAVPRRPVQRQAPFFVV